MQKKIIALAIAGLAAAPVFAQDSNVTIYGRANLGFDNYSATGAAAGSAADFKGRNRLYDYSSRIGFKGTEGLGNGLKANFQIESGVNMDTGSANGQSGNANVSTGTLGSRQSYLGLEGGFGEIRAGRQEVHWTGGRVNDLGANQWGFGGPISTGSAGSVGGPTARTSNVLMYWTPNYSGAQFAAGYIAGAEAAQAGIDTNGKGWTVEGNYNNGPIAVKYDYTTITVQNTAAAAPATGVPVNSGHKLMLGYFYQGNSHVGLTFNMNKHENSAAIGTFIAAGDDLKQNSWNLNWEHYFGNVEAIVEFGQAAAVSGMSGATANSGESKYSYVSFGGLYRFSKRTTMYANYGKVTNKSQQYSDFTGGGISSAGANALPSTSAGADPRIVGVGMMHNF